MLSAIDNAKVGELLKARRPQYFVTASYLVVNPPPKLSAPETAAYGGAYFATPKSLIEAEKYITSLRNKVLASGMSLKSAEELDREIDQMRRNH